MLRMNRARIRLMDDERDDLLETVDDDESDVPYWTSRRWLLVIVLLVMLLALLFYTLIYPLLVARPVPPLPTPPLSRV